MQFIQGCAYAGLKMVPIDSLCITPTLIACHSRMWDRFSMPYESKSQSQSMDFSLNDLYGYGIEKRSVFGIVYRNSALSSHGEAIRY